MISCLLNSISFSQSLSKLPAIFVTLTTPSSYNFISMTHLLSICLLLWLLFLSFSLWDFFSCFFFKSRFCALLTLSLFIPHSILGDMSVSLTYFSPSHLQCLDLCVLPRSLCALEYLAIDGLL